MEPLQPNWERLLADPTWTDVIAPWLKARHEAAMEVLCNPHQTPTIEAVRFLQGKANESLELLNAPAHYIALERLRREQEDEASA